MISPWTIHEADVALYPAWKDGMPYRGPGTGRQVHAPVFQCKSGLSINSTPRKSAASGYNWTGAQENADGEWEINLQFPDGVFADECSRVLSRLPAGGFHVLVVRFVDESSGRWSCFRWYYVTWDEDQAGESGQVIGRSMRLRSTWMQEDVGDGVMPELNPVPMGEVDWICGAQRITCYHFDPITETWTSLARNETGDGTRYLNISPDVDGSTELYLAAYFPRVTEPEPEPPLLKAADITWQNLVIARIGSHLSALHHGLVLMGGMQIQAMGIPEPLMTHSQARMLDEPVIVFRYLRRVYATIGHGVLAVPLLTCNEPPPFTHDYAFRLAVPGPANPDGGQSGMVMLPDGAWLDGSVAEIY